MVSCTPCRAKARVVPRGKPRRWSIAERSCRRGAEPFIVVEVLAPSTHYIDLSAKLAGYLRLPSIARYLIVGQERPRIVHRTRATSDTILARIINEGSIQLDPPRIENRQTDVYAA